MAAWEPKITSTLHTRFVRGPTRKTNHQMNSAPDTRYDWLPCHANVKAPCVLEVGSGNAQPTRLGEQSHCPGEQPVIIMRAHAAYFMADSAYCPSPAGRQGQLPGKMATLNCYGMVLSVDNDRELHRWSCLRQYGQCMNQITAKNLTNSNSRTSTASSYSASPSEKNIQETDFLPSLRLHMLHTTMLKYKEWMKEARLEYFPKRNIASP